jgi:hypothetical protein
MQSRAELWRQSKKARAAEWAAFNASRPDETYEAPADLAALAEAAATIGDYKLKNDAGYVLPEVNTYSKQQQTAAVTCRVQFKSENSAATCRTCFLAGSEVCQAAALLASQHGAARPFVWCGQYHSHVDTCKFQLIAGKLKSWMCCFCMIVLQDQRLTPSRKRSQMLLLVRDMASAQSSFNARVLALRDEKCSLLARLNAARQRLSAVNKLLGITGQWAPGRFTGMQRLMRC